MVAANKTDLIDKRQQIFQSQAEEFCKTINAMYFEVSAKDNSGIEDMFNEVARKLVELRTQTKPSADRDSSTILIHSTSESNQKSFPKCC